MKTLCSTTLQSVGVFMKTERRYAQRHSKVSEWLPGMGIMGVMGNENGYARSVSKISEWLSKIGRLPAKALSQNSQDSQNSRITKTVEVDICLKCRSGCPK